MYLRKGKKEKDDYIDNSKETDERRRFTEVVKDFIELTDVQLNAVILQSVPIANNQKVRTLQQRM